ncbi:sufB/sufD domain-containing protein [Toxoplasma gondii VEG]|uniref:SufB/sufD domain-containing protein n=6 Tax=Toxoplasma gondii TaxID=5811 RepID=V4ZVI6_TOXGV|nr:sufB/sufD domain-containing protein [Toxoplasma gondii VEG]CEL75112.1 TPA: sufB/sufD domain-containing protein [Toxoplasma gondii VEG]
MTDESRRLSVFKEKRGPGAHRPSSAARMGRRFCRVRRKGKATAQAAVEKRTKGRNPCRCSLMFFSGSSPSHAHFFGHRRASSSSFFGLSSSPPLSDSRPTLGFYSFTFSADTSSFLELTPSSAPSSSSSVPSFPASTSALPSRASSLPSSSNSSLTSRWSRSSSPSSFPSSLSPASSPCCVYPTSAPSSSSYAASSSAFPPSASLSPLPLLESPVSSPASVPLSSSCSPSCTRSSAPGCSGQIAVSPVDPPSLFLPRFSSHGTPNNCGRPSRWKVCLHFVSFLFSLLSVFLVASLVHPSAAAPGVYVHPGAGAVWRAASAGLPRSLCESPYLRQSRRILGERSRRAALAVACLSGPSGDASLPSFSTFLLSPGSAFSPSAKTRSSLDTDLSSAACAPSAKKHDSLAVFCSLSCLQSFSPELCPSPAAACRQLSFSSLSFLPSPSKAVHTALGAGASTRSCAGVYVHRRVSVADGGMRGAWRRREEGCGGEARLDEHRGNFWRQASALKLSSVHTAQAIMRSGSPFSSRSSVQSASSSFHLSSDCASPVSTSSLLSSFSEEGERGENATSPHCAMPAAVSAESLQVFSALFRPRGRKAEESGQSQTTVEKRSLQPRSPSPSAASSPSSPSPSASVSHSSDPFFVEPFSAASGESPEEYLLRGRLAQPPPLLDDAGALLPRNASTPFPTLSPFRVSAEARGRLQPQVVDSLTPWKRIVADKFVRTATDTFIPKHRNFSAHKIGQAAAVQSASAAADLPLVRDAVERAVWAAEKRQEKLMRQRAAEAAGEGENASTEDAAAREEEMRRRVWRETERHMKSLLGGGTQVDVDDDFHFNDSWLAEGYEDISAEPRFVPPDWTDVPRPCKNSTAITTLTASHLTKPVIDTADPRQRNRLRIQYFSPKEKKRQAFWQSLLTVGRESAHSRLSAAHAWLSERHEQQQEEAYKNRRQIGELMILRERRRREKQRELEQAGGRYRPPQPPPYPLPLHYLYVNHRLYNAFKLMNVIGWEACLDLPTPHARLEAFRHEHNLRSFYLLPVDDRVSLTAGIERREAPGKKPKAAQVSNARKRPDANQSSSHHYSVVFSVPDSTSAPSPLHSSSSSSPSSASSSLVVPLRLGDFFLPNMDAVLVLRDGVIDPQLSRNLEKFGGVEGGEEEVEGAGLLERGMRATFHGDEESTTQRGERNEGERREANESTNDEGTNKDGAGQTGGGTGGGCCGGSGQKPGGRTPGEGGEEEEPCASHGTQSTQHHGAGNASEDDAEGEEEEAYVGSFLNIRHPGVRSAVAQELQFVPEYSNYWRTNTQPFHRGQIGKTSRKYDSDFAIYDYRKLDFGMAKFSALNLASMQDAACIVVGDDPRYDEKTQEKVNEEKRARGMAMVDALVAGADKGRRNVDEKRGERGNDVDSGATATSAKNRLWEEGAGSTDRRTAEGAVTQRQEVDRERGREEVDQMAKTEQMETPRSAASPGCAEASAATGEKTGMKEKMTLESLIDAIEESQDSRGPEKGIGVEADRQRRKEMKFQVLHLLTSDLVDLLPYLPPYNHSLPFSSPPPSLSSPPAHPLVNPRLVVHVGRGVNCTLHQTFLSLSDLLPENDQQRLAEAGARQEMARPAYMRGRGRGGFVNSNTRIVLESDAELHHVYDQEQAIDSWHMENLSVQMGKNSTYVLRQVDLGAQAGRFNLQIEGAESSRHTSLGLAVLNGHQEHGKYEMFHHLKPRGETTQIMKSLVGGKARAVWRGRIRIERDGIGTAAESLNRVVLLDEGSRCVAIPTLEIIPDDVVKANHGAMIRDLDIEPLFFLMSRGMDELEARKMLMKAYADDVISPIGDENLRERVFKKIFSMAPKKKKKLKRHHMFKGGEHA